MSKKRKTMCPMCLCVKKKRHTMSKKEKTMCRYVFLKKSNHSLSPLNTPK